MAQKISEVQFQLTERLAGIRWVRKENLHLTVKFLGAVEEAKIASIMSALKQALRAVPAFSMAAAGLGVFPDIRRARVLWVRLHGDALGSLAAAVEAALESVGFARDKRDFSPHLTIGRWRSFGGGSAELGQEMEHWKDYSFGECRVEEAILFESVLKQEGTDYSPLGVISLCGG